MVREISHPATARGRQRTVADSVRADPSGCLIPGGSTSRGTRRTALVDSILPASGGTASSPASLILCSISDGIATITLNNPPLNVVTRPLTLALGETLEALERDVSLRVLVVTGAGDRAFCAGSISLNSRMNSYRGRSYRGSWAGKTRSSATSTIFPSRRSPRWGRWPLAAVWRSQCAAI